ncbi:MAG TPA: hypothetical protein VGC06_29125 [Actinomycetes bacterium]
MTIEKPQVPQPRAVGILADPDLWAEDTEDWLRAAWDARQRQP